MTLTNKRIVLSRRPIGIPVQEDFRLEHAPVSNPEVNEVLLENEVLACSPGDRRYLNNALPLGSAMRGHTISRVLEAGRQSGIRAGQRVVARGGWQNYATVPATSCRELPATPEPRTLHLGVLGAQGLTAFFGLFNVGALRPGETVLISGVSGVVGSVAAQLAKSHGARVIGVCRSDPARLEWLRNAVGIDDIANEEDLPNSLNEVCPRGFDLFFDNAGGRVLDATLAHAKRSRAKHARFVLCGSVSEYNRRPGESAYGVQRLTTAIDLRLVLRGFVVGDYSDQYDGARRALTNLHHLGQLAYREVWADSLLDAPAAFRRMFMRTAFGKTLISISG